VIGRVDLVAVPEYESLDIEPCSIGCGLCYKRVVVAGSVRTAIGGSFPVVIDFHVNVMHASRGVARGACAVSWGEDVECRVGLWTVRILCSTVYRHERVVPVFLVAIASLDAVDLNERGNDLSVGVGYGAGLSR